MTKTNKIATGWLAFDLLANGLAQIFHVKGFSFQLIGK
jgi:hypothetical protein